jgi:hypothetical protein
MNELKEALTLADILTSFSITSDKVQGCIFKFFLDCSDHYLEGRTSDTSDVILLESLIGKCLVILSSIANFAPQGFEQRLIDLFLKNCSNADIINGISAFLKQSSVSSNLFSDFDQCYLICSDRIFHKDENVRRNTLKLLSYLEEKNNVEFRVSLN